MTKTFKKSVAFISAAVMVMTMLLYFPSGIFSIDFGLKASAAATITLSAPTEGDGSSDNPYQISTKEELYWFAACVNGTDGVTQNTSANAVLTADITVNEGVLKPDGTLNSGDFRSWTPIGTSNSSAYTGTFDGQNHTISGLYFSGSSTSKVGLFGYVRENGSVSNAGVKDSYFYAKQYVGGVCGQNYYGTITNCYNTGKVSAAFNDSAALGGVCGQNYYGTITDCYNIGTVIGSRNSIQLGGVCGYNESGTIENCYNTGAVNGSGQIGGVCGYNSAYSGTATITNCYNTGEVSGTENVGGVCGNIDSGTIANCYNKGEVSATGDNAYVGGVCGENLNGTITNCYNTVKVTATGENVCIGGVCGKDSGTIENCYNTGAVNGSGQIGGVCGWNTNIIRNCYFLSGTAKQGIGTDSSVSSAVESKTTSDMYTSAFCGALGYHSQFEKNVFCGLCKNGYQPANKTTHKYNIDGVEGFDEVYEISNTGQLYWFAQQVNNGNTSINAVLTANITVNSNLLSSLEYDEDGNVTNGDSFTSWTPIGNKSNEYTGTFDGQNHTISGLYYNNTDSTTGIYIGLFGYVGSVVGNGSVSNVGVVDSYFKAYNYVGGVCGRNHAYSNGTATITNCYNTGNITATSTYAEVGGVCGHNVSGTITNCYNTGNVTATGTYAEVGGVCGQNNNSGTITNSYNTGNVTATGEQAMVGGVCGQNYYGTITNSYNTGNVTATGEKAMVGGVCGYNYKNTTTNKSTITNCHYDSTVYSGNAVGKDYATGTNAVGKITDDFKRGEVAYLLQSGQTAVNGIIPEVWGQTIGTDKSPVLGGEKVYATTGCVTYNNSSDTSKKEHKYDDNGFCACNGYESANLTTDKYNIDGVDGFDEVYEISNAGQLYWFAQLVNSRNTSVNAVLTDNITVNSNLLSSLEYDKEDNVTNGASFRSWTPIGTSHSIAYTGKFDGQNHTISGLYYYNTYSTIGIYIGLFGYVGSVVENGSVSNVGVVDSYFKAYDYVGGVCGRNHVYSNETATITNCYNTGNITATGTYAEVGGVCGHNVSGTITNCYNTGNVTATGTYAEVGGVCGQNNNSTITNSYNTGNVTATGEKAMVGGVCGQNYYGTITNSYNTGNVTATGEKAMVGGVCGYNYKNTTTNKSTITNCYSLTGTATQAVGYDSESKTYADASKDKTVFHSGEVAYLLSQGENGSVWGQDLSDVNSYPVLDSTKKVYYGYATCNESAQITYSNNKLSLSIPDHNYVVDETDSTKHKCKSCGKTHDAEFTVDDATDTISVCCDLGSVTLKAPTENLTYDGTAKEAAVEGALTGIDTPDILYKLKGSSEAAAETAPVNAGTYTASITYKISETEEYSVSVEFTIEKKELTVSAGTYKVSKVYDRTKDKGTGSGDLTVSGIINDDDVTVNTGTIGEYSGSDAGNDYEVAVAISLDGDNADNYTLGEVSSVNVPAEITKGAQPETAKDPIIDTFNCCSVTLTKVEGYEYSKDGKTWQDSNVFTGLTAGISYTFYQRIKATTNYEASASSEGVPQTTAAHNYTAKTRNSQTLYRYATCTLAAKYYYSCSVCGDVSKSSTFTYGSPLGHNYTKQVISDSAKISDATCTSPAKYHYSCSRCNLVSTSDTNVFEYGDALAHDYTSGGICTVCDTLENGKDGFRSASLTLTDGVIINYYMLLSDTALADTKAYIHFTTPQKLDVKIMLSEGVEDSGKYKFSLELRPDQMADVITAQVVYSDGSLGGSIDYSVEQYVDAVDNSGSSEDVKNLADAMLNFGAFTQLYTGNNTDDLATNVVDYTENAVIGDEYKHKLTSNISDITVKGATLQIGAYTTIRVKYQLAEGADINDFTFKCGDTVLIPEKSEDYYYVYLRNIRPQNLDEIYSFTVSDGTDTTTLEYSAFSYVKSILDNADKYDKNIVNLMNAMYYYNEAANAISSN